MALAVADHWFETRRLADDVTLIWEPYVDPGIRCNIWHVRGRERDLLVDSGMGLASLRQEVSKISEKPVLCVASHSHFDHVGGHHEFAERLIHPAEAEILAAPDRDNTVIRRYVTLEIFRALPFAGFDPETYCIRAAPATGLIEEGDVIDLGDRHFNVMHLPGHSPGCIALWESATDTLYSGDVIYDGPLYDDLYHSVVEDYVASMVRLKALAPRVVHGGHYDSFGIDRFRLLIEQYLAGQRLPDCPMMGGASG